MAAQNLTQKHLKEILHYDPETGLFTWLQGLGNRRKGALAGCVCPSKGYWKIGVLGKRYHAHRLAYFYMVGIWPIEVDHVNHNRIDNRWANLRPASRRTNGKNCSLRTNNSSGICGVYYDKCRDKWVAEIMVNQKKIHGGRFDSLLDAASKRKKMELIYGFHANHGEAKPNIEPLNNSLSQIAV